MYLFACVYDPVLSLLVQQAIQASQLLSLFLNKTMTTTTTTTSRIPTPEQVAAWSEQLSSLRAMGYVNTAACVEALDKYYNEEEGGLGAVVEHLGPSSEDKSKWSEQLSALSNLGYKDQAACVEALDNHFEDGGLEAVVAALDNTDL